MSYMFERWVAALGLSDYTELPWTGQIAAEHLIEPDSDSSLLFSKVVDLLVSMCRSALESPRKVVIFEPYPSVVDPNDPQMLAFNPRVSGPQAHPCTKLPRTMMEALISWLWSPWMSVLSSVSMVILSS
jgi:hypothetical protein